MKPSVKRGAVSVNTELQNLSMILYRVPSERVHGVVPSSLTLETTKRDGENFAWLSVVSYLDQGSRHEGQSPFEQTNYRLHVRRHGQPGHWLLGISLGSLSGVGTRNMWSMPWRLSAMEFQVSYDKSAGRYSDYRLQTQSQWANASWEITDTGQLLNLDQDLRRDLPTSLASNQVDNYFQRRDGSVGLYQTHNGNSAFTSAKLKSAQSDLIERLGLLTRDEIHRPELVALQHQATCQFFSPAILGERTVDPRYVGPRQGHLAYAS